MTGRHRRGPTHWGLMLVGITTLLVALFLGGYTSHRIGPSSTVSPSDAAKAPAIDGNGSIIDYSKGRLTSRGLPARTVALTFDDGPDPRWTPRILAVLHRERVPATFFVVGSRAAAHPDLVRQEIAAGQEIGSRTFTNADLAALPRWHSDLELAVNQLTLSGAAGVTTSLLRIPHTSGPGQLVTRDMPVLRRATRDGYIVVLADRDSADWRRPGVAAITRNAVPANGAGAVIQFHDGGGDRAETIAALSRVIRVLKQRNYQFVTVSAGVGLSATAGMRQVGTLDHWRGIALLLVLRCATVATSALSWLLVPLAALALLRTILLLVLAHRQVAVVRRRPPDNGWVPLVSVIIPAYNEAVGIAATVRSVMGSNYPSLEVIVVDDGSSDGTADIVHRLGLANVRIIRQANAGKPAALRTGIRAAHYDIVVLIDGDTIFEPETIRRLVQPLRDERVGAVSGNTKVGNRRGLLGRWQHLEYVIGFNLDRRMYDILRCMPTVPGAVGAFPRAVLRAVGNVSDDTLAEDADLTMAINRAGYRVVYAERAIAWTEAPSGLGALWRQRFRWCYGTLQAVWKHRAALREPGPGWRLGRIGLPYLLAFQFLLPLLAPVIDLYAVYGLVFLDPVRVAAIWLGFLALQLSTGIYALHLDRERLRPLWALPIQQIVYRQLMYLVVVRAILTAAAGARPRWHKINRTGDVTLTRPPVLHP